MAECGWSNELSWSAAYLSQWEAPGVPYSQWWRGCFTASDFAVTLGALLILWAQPKDPRDLSESSTAGCGAASWSLGWSALVVFGFATAASDVLPTHDNGTACLALVDCLLPEASARGDLGAWRAWSELVLGVH